MLFIPFSGPTPLTRVALLAFVGSDTPDWTEIAERLKRWSSHNVLPPELIVLATVDSARLVENYRTFIKTVLQLLQRRKSLERRCNLFTTNYDGCFPLVADELVREGNVDFVLNDGARGFRRRYLQARNFNTYLCQTGVFERHQTSVPQINLVHVHGSVYWKKDGASIVVDYDSRSSGDLLDAAAQAKLAPFSACLANTESNLDELPFPDFTQGELDAFMSAYHRLPIVNPTKWKFFETVFEEHYYQMLRMLSYELEKPNAVLITFGFSFADEHILNLVKRSLANPHLQVFVCCFSQRSRDKLQLEFKGFDNVRCLALDEGRMDFSAFNERVFTLDESPSLRTGIQQAANEPIAPVIDLDGGAAA
ncbi:hypothetical protein [Pararobbsia alpina]|uniref:hypothetical protein n=1 Tax=Pararobbsia alpina TaxID=621374 RepID=UPI0039A76B46